ncbi:MAG: 3-phosphoshikimate 1-carboxyvinyltransferase [Gammaproteobacteria bacterium]
MKITIPAVNNPIRASVTIPGSKSMTNRALLLAALADGVSEISRLLISDDTRALVNALHELGIELQLDEINHTCIVNGNGGHFPNKHASIWCDSAGTVARFLLAACAISPGKYFFDATPQLRARPISPLLKVLCAQGAKLDPKDALQMPLTIKGTDSLVGGEVEIEGSETGQFISALLMVAPFATTPIEILSENIVSRPFVDMTCAMMADFGVLVRRMHSTRFLIPVPQRYKATNYVIEPDLSTASYFFAAAAVTGGEVTIQAFNREDSKQGDVRFLSILEKMGCEISEVSSGFTVSGPKELSGVNVDMRDYSDVFMTLAAVAPFAKSPTTITNIGHTRLQESNRITVMRSELEKLHVKVEEGPDWLRIYPSEPKAAVIDTHRDHRIAMSFSIIGLKVPGVVIDGAECVSKTCPEFFTLWEKLVT